MHAAGHFAAWVLNTWWTVAILGWSLVFVPILGMWAVHKYGWEHWAPFDRGHKQGYNQCIRDWNASWLASPREKRIGNPTHAGERWDPSWATAADEQRLFLLLCPVAQRQCRKLLTSRLLVRIQSGQLPNLYYGKKKTTKETHRRTTFSLQGCVPISPRTS